MTHERIHHVSCTLHSEPAGTPDFDDKERLSVRLQTYARKLGFDVMYENVDREEIGG